MKKNSKFSHNEQTKLKTIFATIGVAFIVFMSAICDSIFATASPNANIEHITLINPIVDSTKIYKDSLAVYVDSLDNVKDQLITEVDTYIKKVANRSKMTGEYIVERCLEHDYDITLLMAQAHQETHFAARGGRNNVFGLHNKRYSNPNFAVDDYIALMQRRYIINRTPEELIASNFRMEYNRKAKYAGDPNYGTAINRLRNNIHRTTTIDDLFNKYMNLKSKRDSLRKNINFDSLDTKDSTRIRC